MARLSVELAGGIINLSEISRLTGLHRAYLSHVFLGTRDPTLKTCHRIADALGMDVGMFVSALDKRIQTKQQQAA